MLAVNLGKLLIMTKKREDDCRNGQMVVMTKTKTTMKMRAKKAVEVMKVKLKLPNVAMHGNLTLLSTIQKVN